jgi:hypothetical protein
VNTRARRLIVAVAGVLVVGGAVGACGDDGDGDGGDGGPQPAIVQQVEAAAHPEDIEFPQSKGRTLQQIADLSRTAATFAPATSHYVVGENRIAFGLLDGSNQLIYAPTAVYLARTPEDPASGPYYAPTDSLVTKAAFRSETAAFEGDPIAGVYAAEIPLPKPGRYAVLVLSQLGGQWRGAPTEVTARADDPIPAVGDQPPPVETDTFEDAGPDVASIDTRQPPSDMHRASFADVVGEKPVALLFATPALCESRVCGPVVDIAEQLRTEGYGEDVEFIHQEVYVENDPSAGLRPPLQEFNLQTEPWLFTVDADGKVAARLEGSFGLEAFDEALRAAGGSPD